MTSTDQKLYTWLAVIVIAGIIICVIILKKQKEQRERQNAVKAQRKAEASTTRSAAAPSRSSEPVRGSLFADEIDLKQVLDSEDLRLLSTDLSCLADKLTGQNREIDEIKVVRVVSELVSRTGVIPKQALNLCVAAAQDMVDSVAATFGLSMGGHNAMLEKLKKLQEEYQ